MEEPIISPDGKYMWTGSEWIPSPPSDDEGVQIQDSVVMGGVTEYRDHSQTTNTYVSPSSTVSQQIPIYYPQGNKSNSGDIIVGVICLIVALISFSDYQNSICGTFLSPLAGDDCTAWNAFNFICGGFGLLAIILGIRGKPQPPVHNLQPNYQYTQKPKSGYAIALICVLIGISLLAVFSGILYVWADSISDSENLDPDGDFDNDGIINSKDSDDDDDGFFDSEDWYDKGNGGIEISFNKFQVWSNGNYDSGGGLPDVYAYVGIGNANCGNMQYFSYLDDINVDASVLYDWKSFVYDFDEDATSVCVEVTIYDEDSWAPDEILDFIPGAANYYQHSIDLSSGEGNQEVDYDNRGENALSIELEYELKRIAINS
tara:strand:+ start:324 stop:1442 length:1119 start_codon:yes stop_codon:yes gene_type:complete